MKYHSRPLQKWFATPRLEPLAHMNSGHKFKKLRKVKSKRVTSLAARLCPFPQTPMSRRSFVLVDGWRLRKSDPSYFPSLNRHQRKLADAARSFTSCYDDVLQSSICEHFWWRTRRATLIAACYYISARVKSSSLFAN